MNREAAISLLERLRNAQNQFYGGSDRRAFLGGRLRKLENKLMRAMRDPLALEILALPTATLSVSALRGHRFLLLVTSRRDGRRVATPMWFAADGGRRLILRSGATDPKLDRIRRDRRVIVAACNARGKPLGCPMRALARILPQEEEAEAELVMKRALGWKRDLYTYLRAPLLPMTYIEVAPDDIQR